MEQKTKITMKSDDDELNEILVNSDEENGYPFESYDNRGNQTRRLEMPGEVEEEERFQTSGVQWSTSNGQIFIPTGSTVPKLKPGVYEIGSHPSIGIYFEKIPVKTEGILKFPEATTQKVVEEIQKFWDRESIFRDFSLTYKRGIILWGPPGGGKSCTLQLVCVDVIERDGVVFKFNNPLVFSAGLRKFREIQPETPVVVLMEDIDSTLRIYSETEVINILDGVDRMDKIVFLATTNYPEQLGARIINRPSRFDKRFKVGHPNEQSRKMYFEHLVGDRTLNIDVAKWVEDTKGFSIAHLKELFVAVIILGDEYDKALETLKSMKSGLNSDSDNDDRMGFIR